MKKTKLKKARKATPEQIAAMNRELELRGANFRYALDENRRITKTPFYVRDELECF